MLNLLNELLETDIEEYINYLRKNEQIFNMFLQQNQLDALISQIYFWNNTLHFSESSSVHHQEFFTVRTAMVSHTGLLRIQ